MRVSLGSISHLGLTVSDPKISAFWWESNFEVTRLFEFDDVTCVANAHFMLILRRGQPSPQTLGHMAFNVADMLALETALSTLRHNNVDLEDPGDEIGPVGEGSSSTGLWFHDPDGYRFELFVKG